MGTHEHSKKDGNLADGLLRSRLGFVLLSIGAAGVAFLTYQHLNHIPREYILIAALLAVCVGVHGFAHGGHGSHGSDKQDGK